MRLWSLHPSYLDSKGLVALWREALLAQAVVKGETRGYRHHPQLARFQERARAPEAIADYLRGILAEAQSRGYRFDEAKIGATETGTSMRVTNGQLEFERSHLAAKLRVRDPAALERLERDADVRAHPIFRVVDGPVADFERGAL